MINEDRHDHEVKRLQGTGKVALALYDGLVWNATVSYQNEQFLWSDYNSSKSQIIKKNGKAHRHTTADHKKVFDFQSNTQIRFNGRLFLGRRHHSRWLRFECV